MSQPDPPPASRARAKNEEIQALITWLQQDPAAAKKILARAQLLWPSKEFDKRENDNPVSEALAHPLVTDAIIRVLRRAPQAQGQVGSPLNQPLPDLEDLFGAMRSIRSRVAGQEAKERGRSHEDQLKHAAVAKTRKRLRNLIGQKSDPLGSDVLAATLDLADALVELGIVLQAQNHFTRHFRSAVSAVRQQDGATEVFTEALNLRTQALQAAHPAVTEADLVATLRRLIVVLRAQDRNDEAEPHCTELTRILQKLRGPRHPDLAKAIYHHAVVLRALGSFPKAESRCFEAFAIQEQALAENHPHVSPRDLHDTLHQLVTLYRYQRKNPAELEERARRIPKAPAQRHSPSASDRETSELMAASADANWPVVVDHLFPSQQWAAEVKSGGQPIAAHEPVAVGNPEENLIIEQTRERFFALFGSHPHHRLYAEGKLNNLSKKLIQNLYGLSDKEYEAARKKYDRTIDEIESDGQLS